jgi:hypothetical protein
MIACRRRFPSSILQAWGIERPKKKERRCGNSEKRALLLPKESTHYQSLCLGRQRKSDLGHLHHPNQFTLNREVHLVDTTQHTSTSTLLQKTLSYYWSSFLYSSSQVRQVGSNKKRETSRIKLFDTSWSNARDHQLFLPTHSYRLLLLSYRSLAALHSHYTTLSLWRDLSSEKSWKEGNQPRSGSKLGFRWV